MSYIQKEIIKAVEYVNQETHPAYILENVGLHYHAFTVRTVYAPVHKKAIFHISINFSLDYNPYYDDYCQELLKLTNENIGYIYELLMKDKEEEELKNGILRSS